MPGGPEIDNIPNKIRVDAGCNQNRGYMSLAEVYVTEYRTNGRPC